MRTLTAAKNCFDWHSSTPVQMGVAGFIAEGHLSRHVRKMRALYDQRRRLVTAYITDRLDKWLEPIPSLYGMHVAALGRQPIDFDAVCADLLESNVRIHSLDRYYLGPATRHGIVLGYGVVDAPEIEHGLSLLHKTLSRSR
jgi:GntR family transcriptional regulator/MocR family aminotransferase